MMRRSGVKTKRLFNRALLKPCDIAAYFQVPVREIYKRMETGKLATLTLFRESFVLRESVISLEQQREHVR